MIAGMVRSCGVAGLIILTMVLFAGVKVASAQQETTCIQCHGAQGGRLGGPVEQWRGSIHAVNGISCHGCHGGDPTVMSMEAMSPERGFLGVPAQVAIPGFCGRCHVGVKEDYLGSAHGRALGVGGPHCVTCHGNHAVRRASPDLINPKDCTRCHEYGRAEEIRAAVVETDRMITELDRTLDALHRTGIDTRAMQGELFALRNAFHRLFHSVEVEKVRQQTAGFRQKLGEVRAKVDGVERQLARRRLWGGGAVALLLLGGMAALLLHRTYLDDDEDKR
jgi:hypothetical protein